jgi:hypothetical protein
MEFIKFVASLAAIDDPGINYEFRLLKALCGLVAELREWQQTQQEDLSEAADCYFWCTEARRLLTVGIKLPDPETDLTISNIFDYGFQLVDLGEKYCRSVRVRSYKKISDDYRKIAQIVANVEHHLLATVGLYVDDPKEYLQKTVHTKLRERHSIC